VGWSARQVPANKATFPVVSGSMPRGTSMASTSIDSGLRAPQQTVDLLGT
jgi:hypothetical protein